MINIQSTLDRIDAVLAECDARQLPPLRDPLDDAVQADITSAVTAATHAMIDRVEAGTRQLALAEPTARRRRHWPWTRR